MRSECMSQEKLKNRSDVSEELTWDVSHIYVSKEDFDKAVQELKKDVEEFITQYEGKLINSKVIIKALKEYEKIRQAINWIAHYAFLPEATDLTNQENTELSRFSTNLTAEISAK